MWGLSITLTYSRHSFLWPLIHQTVEATIEGLEQAWVFLQGCPKRLKLGPLLPTLPERLTLARAQQLDYVAFLTLLLADEVQRRDQQALERDLIQAGFEDRVALDGFDWTSPVQLDRRQLQHVFMLEFLARKEHCIFVGPVRVGKTLLAQWLGSGTVRAGHSVLFVRADALLADLSQARADRTYDKVFRRYLAPDLVLLDDFLRAPRGAMFPRGLRDPPLAAAAAGRS